MSFVLEADKKDAFEDILSNFMELKLKVEYEPMNINQEKVYIY